MSIRLFVATILAAALTPGAVLAQGQGGMSPGGISSEQTQQLPQEIKNKLQQFGLTDVKVLPRSFVVTGKDKNGDQVNMLIGPHAMIVLTESSGAGTTGSEPLNK